MWRLTAYQIILCLNLKERLQGIFLLICKEENHFMYMTFYGWRCRHGHI